MYPAKERSRQAAQTVKSGGTLNRRPYGGSRSLTAQRATQSPSFPRITEEEVREEALNRMLAEVYDAPTARVPASSYLAGGTSTPATPYAAGPQAGIVKTPERKERPSTTPTVRTPASTYLTGGASTPATPYAAGPQAGIVKTPERKKTPSTTPTVRTPASTYLTGGASTPATPYGAGLQAGIVRQPVQRPPTQEKEPEKKPEEEQNTLPWERFRGQSAEELEQLHTAAMADRDATYAQIGAIEKEHAGPNSTYGASAGLYKPREENPFSGSAATSGGWVSRADRELNSLRLEAGRQQDTVNDLAAAYYHRENQEQFARLAADADSKQRYESAKELTAELDAIDKALNAPTTYNDQDVRFKAAGDALLRKYGVGDLFTLRQRLKSQKAKLVDELTAQGYNFETMAGYDRMLTQEENYLRMQAKWEKEAEEHPFWASGLSVVLSPLQSVDAPRTWLNGIGHSNADDLSNYVPANVYDMYATNAVQTIRKTVSKQIEKNTDWELFGQNVASFLYNTGMSAVDSALQEMVFGKEAAIILMGCSSAANTTKKIIERGGSNEQAVWGGLAAGAAELVVENFSVDNLPELKNARNWEGALKAVSAKAGVSASKRMLTKVSNILSDPAVMGDRSEWLTAAREYEEHGLSPNEAWLQATLDRLGQVGWAGIEGILLSAGE